MGSSRANSTGWCTHAGVRFCREEFLCACRMRAEPWLVGESTGEANCATVGGVMITITNEKVAGFDPRWATFRGFSLLFDNPGHSLTPAGEWLNLTCAVDTDPDLAFYKALRESLDA